MAPDLSRSRKAAEASSPDRKVTAGFRRITPSQNLTEQVATALGDEILNGRYEVGDALQSEAEMAKSFGVSRTVMREAVSRLKADGLVTSKQGAGMFVLARQRQIAFQLKSVEPTDIDKILQIVELRQGFEVEAAGLAALRATADDLASIRAQLDIMGEALDVHDSAAGVRADVEFHLSICRASGNPYYPQIFETFRSFLLENISVSRDFSSRRAPGTGKNTTPSHREHLALFSAIEGGDEHAARLRAREHIENTRKRLISASPPSQQSNEIAHRKATSRSGGNP
jgi:GntR family transcriptional repressor for pyruvate dehydrogenase complex